VNPATGVAEASAEQVVKEIRSRDRFLLTAHEGPDGDALGSLLGMAGLSAAIAVPLSLSADLLTRAGRVLQFAVGAVTVGLGCAIVFEQAQAAGLF